MSTTERSRWWGAAVALLGLSLPAAGEQAPAGDATPTFEKDVRPILKAYCFDCHGEGEKLRGGLDLRLQRLIVKGGDSGPAVVPGKHDESLLYERVLHHEMPPGEKKLGKEQVDLIGRWIAAGAKTARPEPAEVSRAFQLTEEERSFWAYQPIRQPPVPAVKNVDRVRTPMDAFLLAKLEEKRLSFSADADKLTLLRRACFDLLGLPPTPEQVEEYFHDARPDAYERLIDRLLASPHYGERWARHWLDIAGYADSDGYTEADPPRPYAYKYRDYVVRSLNADKPWDRFIQEQLAGDEMVKPPYKDLSPEDLDRLTA